MSMHGGSIAIVGAAETDEIGVVPGMSFLELQAQASLNALRDAGLTPRDVDGVITAGPMPIEISHHLGITPRLLDGTVIGGGSYMLHVRHAAAAIASGAADVVLISHGESGRTRNGSPGYGSSPQSLAGQFEAPYGAMMPYHLFTLPAMRFLHDRGMSDQHLAEVVVSQRKWAEGNPRAMRNVATSVEKVLGGSVISYPFRKEMCCVVSDAGGALVLTSAERVADLARPERAVYLLGSGEAAESTLVAQMEDVGSSAAFRQSSAEAFGTAGLSTADIDHLMCYDAFAHVPLYMLEDLGFVGHGESGAFVAEGNTSPGGSLPMNTNGGGLSYTHTGMYGMFAIQEAVRQLRGEAFRQVEDVRTSFVQGVGLYFAGSASLVLGSEKP